MRNPTLLRGDARALPLADRTVDLVVTSPPYFAQRSYTDGGKHYAGQIGDEVTPAEYIANLVAVTRECARVLKPGGSIFVNLGDKYVAKPSGDGSSGRRDRVAAGQRDTRSMGRSKSLMLLPERYRIACTDELDLIARAVLVWSKPNGLPEGQVRDRVYRTHEDWIHLTKQASYYSDCDAIRQAHAPWTAKAYQYEQTGYARRANGDRVDQGGFLKAPVINPLGKMPGSVWEVATQPLNVPACVAADHFAAYPMEWPRRIIRGWSPEGGTVLDPFGGTGTTAMVAEALGRRGVSVEMSADYQRIARWRTNDPGERAKALGVAKPALQLDGQSDLFEMAGMNNGSNPGPVDHG
jgi:site-specific DNA-methyltransferase (cytosine-N4-specific)